MITRHLTQMAEFAQSFEPGKRLRPFVLHRPPGYQDELSVLADGLNDAYAACSGRMNLRSTITIS
jgi:hypothetical protein